MPDLGPRDEHGLEPVDKLFSSPQKGRTPSRQNVTTDDSDSESMEVTNGTSDNASSILRSARHRSILPPRSRSPRRTNLGSSPVRPMGQVSSPLQSRHSLSQAPRRSGKFDRSDKGRIRGVDSAGPSPGSSYQRKVRSEVAEFPRRSQPRTQNYDVLEDDDEPPEEEVLEDDIAEVDAGDMDLADQPATFDADVNNDLVSPIVDDIEEQQASANESSPEPETQKTKRAPKRKNHELEVESESAGLGRRNEATKKPRGQPHEDQFSDALEEAATLDNSLVDAAPSVALAKKKKRGPGQRNPKARISSTKSRNSEREPAPAGRNKREDVSIATEDAKPKKTKPRARPLLHRQEDTPQDEEVSLKVLRSGRTSVKPLAFWRGEHIVYEPPKRMGTDWLPGGYRGIDPGRRTVEYQPKTTKRKATRTRAVSREPTESQEEPQELWETEGEVPGVLAAGVPVWDPDLEQSTEDAYEEVGTYPAGAWDVLREVGTNITQNLRSQPRPWTTVSSGTRRGPSNLARRSLCLSSILALWSCRLVARSAPRIAERIT